MLKFRSSILTALLVASALLAGISASFAQAPGATVYDIRPSKSLGAVQTLAGQGSGTVASAVQAGFGIKQILCTFIQTTNVQVPSTTFNIQYREPVTGVYYSVVTSSAITTILNVPTPLAAGAGLPATANVTSSLPVPVQWRTTVTISGTTTPTVTGNVSCQVHN